MASNIPNFSAFISKVRKRRGWKERKGCVVERKEWIKGRRKSDEKEMEDKKGFETQKVDGEGGEKEYHHGKKKRGRGRDRTMEKRNLRGGNHKGVRRGENGTLERKDV